MGKITKFYGITVKIFFTGYNPPHFQALYDDTLGIFKIDTLEMVEGDLTDIAQSLVKEWAEKYKTDLMEMWNSKTLKKLPPLE